MSEAGPSNFHDLDALDREILQSLQINGRAAFSVIAAALGTSEQTVARRYRRMRAAGVVRVVGVVDPITANQLDWMIRITCRPHASTAVATALAHRDDVSWVSLIGAGNEIVASLRARTQDARDELLLRQLPKTEQVLDLSAWIVMHRFTGRYEKDWSSYGHRLDPSSIAVLRGGGDDSPDAGPTPAPEPIRPEDGPLITALALDGRTSLAALAQLTNWTQGRTKRRLDALIGSGTIYLDVDLSTAALGFPLMVMLWMSIEPRHLDSFGNALVAQPEMTFAGATTGRWNLFAAVAMTGVDELYRFVNRIGDLAPGLQQMEVVPVIDRIKQAGSMVNGGRLVDRVLPPARTTARRRR
ncbi:DNA-binding transcriptional regulator, Lrp family [Nakamurella panacisegetis]|uniref:DNA-binding transcriptional regulator, Lrp family n=1 Tax=Nakamurella panacisegetis TaxID=1090615 RepID=A0A1H0SC32_9ACTN|nr:AsnC family transcriptional regulator [Nakamurella panacisegetis]SDP39371.1 DNA-binding transcriptional regulator, Lrp family [Nakamurella panacisegetis]